MANQQKHGLASREDLTEKQRRFVEAITGVAKGNAAEAARLAGYKGSPNTLKSIGAENLTKPDIRAAIAARESEAGADPLQADGEEIRRWWTSIFRGVPQVPQSNPLSGEPIIVERDDPTTGERVREVLMMPADMRDRLKASEHLAKALGIFKEPEKGDDKLGAFLDVLQRGART